jgi:hypothetical protein
MIGLVAPWGVLDIPDDGLTAVVHRHVLDLDGLLALQPVGLDGGARAVEPIGERFRRDVVWRVAAFDLVLALGHGDKARH